MTKAKVDLTEFFKLSRPKSPPCKLAPVLAQLSEAETEQYEAAQQADTNVITNQALALWLERHVEGHNVNWQNCLSHRAKKCGCFSD